MSAPAHIARENGKKGGRPKGTATLEREKAREYIAERIGAYMPAIFEALTLKAVTGDIMAIRELFDRAFGRPSQAVEMTGKDGEKLIPERSPAVDLLTQALNAVYKGTSVGGDGMESRALDDKTRD